MAGEVALRFGLRLRQRREELGLTQPALARRMVRWGEAHGQSDKVGAVSKQHVWDWEHGVQPSERYIQAMLEVLGVEDISYFYERPSQPDVMGALNDSDLSADAAARLEERLAHIERQLAQLLAQERPQASEPIEPTTVEDVVDQLRHTTDVMERLLGQLGRDVGKRDVRFRSAKDRSQQPPEAAA